MIAYLFFTKGSPGEEAMTALADELRRNQVDSQLVEADSVRGMSLGESYDILSRPAVVLAATDGTQINQWQEQMPDASEISYWSHR
jgi:hypothetical protein